MKRICVRFTADRLEFPLRDLLGEASSADLKTVALAFVQLQDARHRADYDLSYGVAESSAWELFELATEADQAWERLQGSAEANIFILSLLLWKNWERERA